MRHPKRKTTVGDSTRTSSPRWVDLQREIASCRKCREKWSKEITSPLSVGEIPDPPQKVKLLFVGVAPTPSRGKNKGNHFYSDVSDTLRVELFKMLDTLLENANLSHRNASSKEDGDSAFHGLSFFFVHAAKVRPITKSSPSHSAIRFCARRHLAHEIQALKPSVVCFLGAIHAAPAAYELFGDAMGEEPIDASLGGCSWRGKVLLAPQPVRAGKATAPVVLRRALRAAGYTVREDTHGIAPPLPS